jgi:hypothetical protein
MVFVCCAAVLLCELFSMMCLCFVYDDMMVCVYVLFSQLAGTPPPPSPLSGKQQCISYVVFTAITLVLHATYSCPRAQVCVVLCCVVLCCSVLRWAVSCCTDTPPLMLMNGVSLFVVMCCDMAMIVCVLCARACSTRDDNFAWRI